MRAAWWLLLGLWGNRVDPPRDSGAAQSTSQAIVGHNSAAVHQLYTHEDESALRRAVDAIPAVMKELPALPPPAPASREPMPAWIREGLEKMTPENWQAVRDDLLST